MDPMAADEQGQAVTCIQCILNTLANYGRHQIFGFVTVEVISWRGLVAVLGVAFSKCHEVYPCQKVAVDLTIHVRRKTKRNVSFIFFQTI